MMKEKAAKPIHVSCWVKLLNKKLVYAIEKQFIHLFSKIDAKEEWILPYFIDKGDLGDDCIHEDESLNIDFDFKICDSPPQTIQSADVTPLKVKEDPREDTLQKDLVDLHKARKYSDVTLRIGDETFPAHKSILAARSPKFDEIFTNSIEHTNSENEVIEIHDVDKNAMALMLKFIYTNELEDINDEMCLYLYSAAQNYQIPSLLYRCLRILKENLSVKSVYKVLLLSEEFKDSSLKMIAHDCIGEHSEYVYLTPEWYEFCDEDLANQIKKYLHQEKERIEESRIASREEENEI